MKRLGFQFHSGRRLQNRARVEHIDPRAHRESNTEIVSYEYQAHTA